MDRTADGSSWMPPHCKIAKSLGVKGGAISPGAGRWHLPGVRSDAGHCAAVSISAIEGGRDG
jgi:hypothetical protein